MLKLNDIEIEYDLADKITVANLKATLELIEYDVAQLKIRLHKYVSDTDYIKETIEENKKIIKALKRLIEFYSINEG